MVVAVCLGGCSLYDHGAASDARVPDGEEIDAFRVPSTITISGVASARSGSGALPVAGITVTAYHAADLTTPLSTTTTGSDGSYKLPIATHAMAVDVMLETSSPAYVTTYDELSYLEWNTFDVALDMFTPAAYAGAYTATGVQHVAGSAMLEIQVQGIAQGIQIAAASGTVEYTSGGLITGSAASTDYDGIGFVLNATQGTDDISASSNACDVYNSISVLGISDALMMATVQVQPPMGGD